MKTYNIKEVKEIKFSASKCNCGGGNSNCNCGAGSVCAHKCAIGDSADVKKSIKKVYKESSKC